MTTRAELEQRFRGLIDQAMADGFSKAEVEAAVDAVNGTLKLEVDPNEGGRDK